MTQSNGEVSTKSVLKPSDSTGNLAPYFTNAKNGDFDLQSDFSLVSEEGKTIKTHKIILASHFSKFRDKFRENPKLYDYKVSISYSILKKFVDSLYSKVPSDFSSSDIEALKLEGLEQTSICAVSRNWKLRATSFDNVAIALNVIMNVMKVEDSAIHGPNNLLSSDETVKESLMGGTVNDTMMALLKHSTFSVHIESEDVVKTVLRSYTLEDIFNTSAKIRKDFSSGPLKHQLSNFMSLMPSCLVDNIDPFVVVDTKCSSNMFGYQPGQKNLTGILHLGIIREITISTRTWDGRHVVKGLRILFQNGGSLEIGLDDQQPKETKTFDLHDDEYISYVQGSAGYVLDSLAFVTNKGRHFGPVGGDGGSDFCTLTCRHRKLLKENRNSARVVLRGIAAREGTEEMETIMTHLQFVTTVMCNPGEEELWDDAVL